MLNGPRNCGVVVSPRRRRWFASAGPWATSRGGLSAQAEVVWRRRWPGSRSAGSLRAGGGGSRTSRRISGSRSVSPRRRRWFAVGALGAVRLLGLSAQAEVVRNLIRALPTGSWSLRAGGGGSRRLGDRYYGR